MKKNRLKRQLAAGETVANGWLHIPSTLSAEVMAQGGFDSLTIDMQHGCSDYSTALPMLQAMGSSPTTPLVRVPWNEPGIIMRMLDAGSYGVICPMVNTPEEAKRFVGACRYPPLGYRSQGPVRVALQAGSDYAAHANEEILTFAMIETAEALDNLGAILETPGLDAVYVGPGDLNRTLTGSPVAVYSEQPLKDAVTRIASVAQERGIIAGAHTNSAEDARWLAGLGYRFLTIENDVRFIAQGAQRVLRTFRSELRPEPVDLY